MALPAGRVGVNPADVDPITGHVKGTEKKNQFETGIDIKDATSENPFIVPDDGYVRFAKDGTTKSEMRINAPTIASSSNSIFFGIPVTKGMKISFTNSPEYGTYFKLK